MGFFDWFRGSGQDAFCDKDFKPLWTGFVDAFIDSMHARGPAAAPPREMHEPPPAIEYRKPAVKRIISIGDIHGDLGKLKRALKSAGLINDDFRWVGGSTVVVQVGDQLDRGDDEVQVLYALERLQREASRDGGAVHVLNGNHETMNIAGDFRYATTGANAGFARWFAAQALGTTWKQRCKCSAGWSEARDLETGPLGSIPARQEYQACRWSALQPGSAFTRRFFAGHPIVLQIGSTVFVHGGLLPQHLDIGVDKINRDTQEWMFGARQVTKPTFLRGSAAVVWAREYSMESEDKCKCDALRETLARMQASRMVVGHTIQRAGVNSACDERVIRVDVGMSAGCGDAAPQVLEIVDDRHLFRIAEDGSRTPVAHAAAAWHAQFRQPERRAAEAA